MSKQTQISGDFENHYNKPCNITWSDLRNPHAPTHTAHAHVCCAHCAAPLPREEASPRIGFILHTHLHLLHFTAPAPYPTTPHPHRCTPRTRAPSCTLFLQLASPISCVLAFSNIILLSTTPSASRCPALLCPPPYTPPHACRVVHVRAVPHPAPETAPPCASRSITTAWHVPLAHFTPSVSLHLCPTFVPPVVLS